MYSYIYIHITYIFTQTNETFGVYTFSSFESCAKLLLLLWHSKNDAVIVPTGRVYATNTVVFVCLHSLQLVFNSCTITTTMYVCERMGVRSQGGNRKNPRRFRKVNDNTSAAASLLTLRNSS